ncbi:MAG: hypothetical protein KDK76_06390 [Chlamydiia bacterium]|nr:hypothetical protein [Chlamydiia bacterium]
MAVLLPASVPSTIQKPSFSRARDFLETQAYYHTPLGGDKNLGGGILLASEAIATADYLQNKEAPPPLGGRTWTQIWTDIQEMRVQGYSFKKMVGVLAQTALIAKAYITHYNTIIRSEAPALIPMGGILIPAAMLYMNGSTLIERYNTWQEAETAEERYHAFTQMMGSAAACLINIIQAVSYFLFFEIAEPLILMLSTLNYFAATVDILKSEYNHYEVDLKEKLTTPPKTLFI